MEFTTLTIQLPHLSGEQAAQVQQTLYAFLDAFDTHYCFAIERYHQDLSSQDYSNNLSIDNLIHELCSTNDPF